MVKALYTPDDYDDLTDLVEAEGDKYKNWEADSFTKHCF